METTLLIPAEFEVINASVSKENITLSLLLTSPVGYWQFAIRPAGTYTVIISE